MDIYEIAAKCFEIYGYYPISFSSPKNFNRKETVKTSIVSKIFPYEKYSFENEAEYYQEYEKSHFGITQKKSGWDCFRHLEIIASGTTPLFLDIDSIPKFTMVHYPKRYLQEVSTHYFQEIFTPSQYSLNQLITYANEHLTCEAMCRYFSKVAKIELLANDSILFVDSAIHHWADYLSIFNFIGLKRIYGDQVISAYPEPDYLYTDTSVDTQSFYGRGFGYSRTLTRQEIPQNMGRRIKYVFISHLQRDWMLVEKFSQQYPEAYFLLFWGADEVISNEVLAIVKELPSYTLFVREVN